MSLTELLTRRLGLGSSALANVGGDALQSAPPAAELALLPIDAAPWQQLIARITVGETRFFRQIEWFEEVERRILRPLIEERVRSANRRLRLWSAGCSTGEEPATLAMILLRLLRGSPDWDVTIIASDVNETALAVARRGVYRSWSLREADASVWSDFFDALDHDQYAIRSEVRSVIRFRQINLVEDPWADDDLLRDFDLIVCRNTLMYFSPEHQRRVARRLVASLCPSGWLAVAPAEAVAAWFAPLEAVSEPTAIFFRHPLEPPVPADRQPAPQSEPPRRVVSRPKEARRLPKPAPPLPTIAELRARADAGNLSAARDGCRAILKRDALHHDAHLLLACIAAELGETSDALTAARRAVYVDQDSAPARFLCATLLARLGRQGEAIQQMRTVVRLLADQPDRATPAWDIPPQDLRVSAMAFLDSVADELRTPRHVG